MRILYVQDTDWIRRNPIQHTHLAERLTLRGHQIRAIDYEILWQTEGKKGLLSQRQTYAVSRVLPSADITVIRPRIVKVPLLDYMSMVVSYSGEIYRQIKNFSPDVVIGNDILTTFLAFKLAKKYKIPTIFYSIDIDYKLIPITFLRPLGKFLESSNIKSADLAIAINEGLREYMIQMGAKRNNTLVIRAGIDMQKYDPETIDGSDIRQKYNIGPDEIVLFFMGWLYHFSGLKEVASTLAGTSRNDIKLLIVGDGDAYGELKNLSSSPRLRDKIIMTGKLPYDDLAPYIAAADFCLLPAYPDEKIMQDIVPIKMYEYLAMEKPVISTKLPGVTQEFGQGNGVVYIDHPEDVIDKAVEITEQDKAGELGTLSRRFAEKCDWERITDDFERVLQKLIKEV